MIAMEMRNQRGGHDVDERCRRFFARRMGSRCEGSCDQNRVLARTKNPSWQARPTVGLGIFDFALRRV